MCANLHTPISAAIRNSTSRTISLYFHRSDIGISQLTTTPLRIQCSQFLHAHPPDHPRLLELVSSCAKILTNHKRHPLLQRLPQESIEQIPQGDYLQEAILNNLHRLLLDDSKDSEAQCRRAFHIQRMLSFQLRFKALGMLLSRVMHETKIKFQAVDYFIDNLLFRVQISRGELDALEIVKEEVHPSVIKGKGRSKQGYSVLNLYDSFVPSLGAKKFLRSIFFNPTYQRAVLEQRQELIQWMRRKMGQGEQYRKLFRSLHGLDNIFKHLSSIDSEEDKWRRLLKTLETMFALHSLLAKGGLPAKVKQYVDDEHWADLMQVTTFIKDTIDFNPLGIKTGVDTELDTLKHTYDNLPNLLSLYAEQEPWGAYCRVVFMAQIGYLLQIDTAHQCMDGSWVLQFVNRTGKYYSNDFTAMLDEKYGDIYGEMQDIEKKLLFDLANQVLLRKQIIEDLYWKACELACYWGVSQISRNMCQPKLSSESLIVVDGWHLLLGQTAIDNHCFSFPQTNKHTPREHVYNSELNLVNTNYSNRVSVVSGPNGAGKTIYLKQLGLLVYLAHLGFYLPAQLAEVPLVDRIAMLVKTPSVYSKDCGLKAELIALATVFSKGMITNKSLVLIDELGLEIDYHYAVKLLYATVCALLRPTFPKNGLLQQQTDEFQIPLSVIITHHSSVLQQNQPQSYLLRYLTMQVQEEGTNLFKITPGVVKKGYGIRVAANIMGSQLIKNAEQYWRLLRDH